MKRTNFRSSSRNVVVEISYAIHIEWLHLLAEVLVSERGGIPFHRETTKMNNLVQNMILQR